MLSSRINSNDSDDDGDEVESTMPGDYEPWPRAASRTAPSTSVSPPRLRVPPTSQPSRRPPARPPVTAPKSRLSVTPATSPMRPRRSRQRSITPEIVIERHHRHRLKSNGHRVITIHLDNRPTLGLRGPPKRVLEIERVRCRRRRRHRSSCYEIDYDVPPPSYLQPQSNVMLANSLSSPYLLPAQSSLMTPPNNSTGVLASFLNLTQEKIENLPKQTVHLPPIYLPGSQANANTELDTVVFPAEIINPIDGTLSIIQVDPRMNSGENANFQPSVVVPAQPPLIRAPTNVQSPQASLAMASGPFMQQVQDLFRRITLSQAQSISPPFNHTVVPSTLPVMPQYNIAANSFDNPQTIPSINTTNPEIYPPANIQPTIIPNSGLQNATTFTPASSANITPYRPANITPIQPAITSQYRPANITSYQPAATTPYGPANITPYRSTTVTPNQPYSTTLHSRANTTSYQPANITPYPSSSFTPANPINTRSYRPASIASALSSDIGSYRPANITPYNPAANRSMLPPSIPSASIPYVSSVSFASSDSFSSSPSGFDNRFLNIPNSSQTPHQSSPPMPKSILRNASSNGPLNTTYTRLNPSSVSFPNGIVREMATAV